MAVARRFENNGYSAAASSRTHQTRFEARQREVGTGACKPEYRRRVTFGKRGPAPASCRRAGHGSTACAPSSRGFARCLGFRPASEQKPNIGAPCQAHITHISRVA
jgi:hypothetical protein